MIAIARNCSHRLTSILQDRSPTKSVIRVKVDDRGSDKYALWPIAEGIEMVAEVADMAEEMPRAFCVKPRCMPMPSKRVPIPRCIVDDGNTANEDEPPPFSGDVLSPPMLRQLWQVERRFVDIQNLQRPRALYRIVELIRRR